MNRHQLPIIDRPSTYALVVDCPYCGALAGLYCVTPRGVYAEGSHLARIRLANRLSIEGGNTQ